MLQLLAATSNPHKIEEFKTLLADLNSRVNIVTPDTIPNFPVLIEDGKSFEENAERKAEPMLCALRMLSRISTSPFFPAFLNSSTVSLCSSELSSFLLSIV